MMPIPSKKIAGIVIIGMLIVCNPLQAEDKVKPDDVIVVNAPDVNVTNMPDVNVANTPDVNVANAPDVYVANDVNSPVPVTIQDGIQTNPEIMPSDIVQLLTQYSPTPPGRTVNVNVALDPAGGASIFSIPAGHVLIITDVDAVAPRSNAPLARYVATICDTPCSNVRVYIQLDTRVDGFQKTISLRSGAVFRTIPQFLTLSSNPSDLSVILYGYVAKDE